MIAEFLAAMVEGGMAYLRYPIAPIVSRRHLGPGPTMLELEGIAMAILGLAGFESAETERAVFDDGVTIWARHRCGSWCRAKVPDAEIVYADVKAGPVVDRLLGMGCYCVRREVA